MSSSEDDEPAEVGSSAAAEEEGILTLEAHAQRKGLQLIEQGA